MNVAIAGYGVEGKVSYDYWRDQGHAVMVADERTQVDDLPEGASVILGADAFSKLREFDLIIRSPSVNPKKLPYGEKVWSATNEFFKACSAPIIGVTGTKGKGTTSSLIASILKAAGRTVHLVGNIGTPALAELAVIQPDDVVVYELSSFQLWDAKRSPHIAVVVMIEPDHLDVHDSLEDYLQAKMNILRHQTEEDIAIIYASHHGASFVPASDAYRIEYPAQEGMHVEEGWFCAGSRRLVPVESLQLPGGHNLDNACAALIAASYMIPAEAENDMERIFSEGLRGFTGLPHRLKFVAEKEGVKYYDDSIATTPGSAIAAIKSFDAPKLLILGGQDKGAEYTELIEACAATDTKVLAIGANGDGIVELCHQLGVVCERETGDMDAIVAKAHVIAQADDVVILSPAAASFDMFSSYADRGDQFAAAVSSL